MRILAKSLNRKILILYETKDKAPYGEIVFPDLGEVRILPIYHWLAHYYIPEQHFQEPIMIVFRFGCHFDAIVRKIPQASPRQQHQVKKKKKIMWKSRLSY